MVEIVRFPISLFLIPNLFYSLLVREGLLYNNIYRFLKYII